MSSNDLLSYSIMQGGNKVSSGLPLSLPSLNSLPSNKKIVLPSISTLNQLTESNLNHLNSVTQNYKYNQLTPPNSNINSSPNSLVSSPPTSVKLNSPKQEEIILSPPQVNTPLAPINIAPAPIKSVDITDSDDQSPKRRQRLGPSCDNCRVRKVKCNAEIIVLSNDYTKYDLKQFNLTTEQHEDLIGSNPVYLNEDHSWELIVSNEKLIKFKPCKSCHGKKLECKFSKGFTKEDILINKKNLKFRIDKNKKIVDNSRKSSCFNCRKRKIKCSINNQNDKCDNCFKRNSQCNFN